MYCWPQLNLSNGCVAIYCLDADCSVAAITPTNVACVKLPESYGVCLNAAVIFSGDTFGGNTRFLYSRVDCDAVALDMAVALFTPANIGEGMSLVLLIITWIPFVTVTSCMLDNRSSNPLSAISSMSESISLRSSGDMNRGSKTRNSAVALMSSG